MIDRLRSNLTEVQQRISDAAQRSGRSASEVTLVGVTKYVDADVTRAFVEAGCRCLGESRPQILWQKSDSLRDLDVEWHLIGHLQRNKAKRTVPITALIHSADSIRLIETINEIASTHQTRARILLEINISGEAAKHGFDARKSEEFIRSIEHISTLKAIQVEGLMAMAGLMGNNEDARREFAALRNIRDHVNETVSFPNIEMNHLSMGMSGDFEAAIEEGSTLVRVGSALFQGI